ncbi:sec1 family transport protein SLY1-like protein [Tanacetum coccineum]
MLNLNQPINASGTANEEVYKILIFDKFCQDILSPLIHVKDLRKHGVTLYFLIDKNRKPVADVPAVYFVKPTPHNIQRIVSDASIQPLAVVPGIRCTRDGNQTEMVASTA